MKKGIILSDLWGKRNSDWMNDYLIRLEKHLELKYYDCCELADIDQSNYSEEQIHRQFTEGGIEKAVKTLVDREQEPVHVLAFSIGGLIAWKAILLGLKAESLTCISSTRLRYEVSRPNCSIHLIYGEHDAYQPTDEWFEKMNLEKKIHPGEEHDFYRKKEIASDVCIQLIKQL